MTDPSYIMCDHQGSLLRNNEIDRDLLATLNALKEMRHNIIFVTTDPGSASMIYAIEFKNSPQWKKRSALTEDEKFVDYLIDDEAARNIREYGIQAIRLLDPRRAAASLQEAFDIPPTLLQKHRDLAGFTRVSAGGMGQAPSTYEHR